MNRRGDLKTQLLEAAVECASGDVGKTFTFEELLVAAWKRDPVAWGLRGFEQDYPDSERIHREVDSRGKDSKGMVSLGYLDKVQARLYRITPKGLAAVSLLRPDDAQNREKADRALEAEIRRILEHPAFHDWQRDPASPKKFRDAGHFWGVAPGTPPRVIKERVARIDDTLEAANSLLDERGIDEIRHGSQTLFDRNDIERCREFQAAMKERFSEDLRKLTGSAVI